MQFEVVIWKVLSVRAPSPDIRTWVVAMDPITAVLSVMAQLGLAHAALALVYHEYQEVGEFRHLDVSTPLSPLECAVSYDYEWS